MADGAHSAADEKLFAELGVTVQAQEHVEQTVIDQAIATTTAVADAATTEAADGSAQGLAEQLLAVEQEEDAVAAALAAQQQEHDQDDWDSSGDEAAQAARASERSNRQLEAAVMRQRMAALEQQHDHLQQQLSALPVEEQQQAHQHQQHLRQQLQKQQQQQQGKRGRFGSALRGRGRGRAGGRRGMLGSATAAAGGALSSDLAAAAEGGPADGAAGVDAGLRMALVETERDRLIRCGLLTPFDRLDGFEMRVQGAPQVQQDQQQQPQQQQGHPHTQQQQHIEASAAGSSRQAPARGPSAIDEQWALLTRNAAPSAAAADASAAVPGDLADMAHVVGRGGLPLPQLLAKAAQQTMELGVTNRPRAILMEPGEVPKQERDVIKVNPMLWRPGGQAQQLTGTGAGSKRPKRASTLPRQKRRRHGVEELRLLSEVGPDGLPGVDFGGPLGGGRQGGSVRGPDGAVGGSGDGGASEGSSSDWEDDWEDSEGKLREGQQEDGAELQQQPPPAAAAAAATGDTGVGQGAHADSGVLEPTADAVGVVGSSDAEAGSEEEYLPSDVDTSARRRRGSSSRKAQPASRKSAATAAAAAAAGGSEGALEDDDMEDLADLVPEGRAGVGRSSSKSSRGRGKRQQAAAAPQRRRKGRQKQQQQQPDASDSAAAAAAAGGLSVPASSSEEDFLAGADAGDVRDELADYDDLDDTVYELRMQRHLEQQARREQEAQQQQQQQAQGGSSETADPAAGAAAAAAGGVSAARADDTAAAEADGTTAAEPGVDAVFDGGFKVPGSIWSALFGYQRTCVKWLWELHNQRAGGIIGDEMGLGKTIQVIAYFAGLHASGMWRPSLVVAPATVLRQWMTELRTWYPPLRVFLLHESGRSPPGSTRPNKAGLLDAALSHDDCSVVLTTYEQLRLQRELLLPVRWGVAVLDEGHKIRNPDAEVTLAAKQLQTVHRIIMSGSPIQNRLSELWSLFDFIFPGKLGILPVFTAQFAIPITIGGYTNASKLQVQTAYRCAVVLRDLISPYLLRRRKADVATQLPKKTETVLFCTLTEAQRDLYRAYLSSADVSEILSGQRQALAGIDVLRKICNHPDLLQRTQNQGTITYGDPSRSGKLQVLVKVLAAWASEGHKVLLFTQTQQMLDIIEKHVVEAGYSYHRMDGNTPIASRGRLMDDFNNNPDRFLFLLTTKVGGLGVNLTGANRVLIYDPDWNPSTDSQARERAWRIGQGRPVTIYRLITSGTIEEKVYHRQIYKSYLTNKVLQDPRQRRFFASRDISDLFTLADEHGGTKKHTGTTKAALAAAAAATETGRIFSDVVREHKTAALPPAGADAAAAARGKKRGGAADGDGPAASQGPQQKQRRRANGLSNGSSGALQETSDAAGAGSPPVSPTALTTAGLAVLAPAQDTGDAAGAQPPDAAAGGTSSAAGGGIMFRQQARRKAQASGAAAAAAVAAAAAAGAAGAGADDAAAAGDADDANVLFDLFDLFDGVGLKSLMDHTSIEGAHDPEAYKADAAAARLAERAAEKLRESRLACQAAAVHVPTWTGRHGAAGMQSNTHGRRSGGPSSRQSSPAGSRPAGAAAAGAGSAAGGVSGQASRSAAASGAPRGRFGQVINPLLTSRPLYTAQARGAAAAAGDGGSGSPGAGTQQQQQLGSSSSPAPADSAAGNADAATNRSEVAAMGLGGGGLGRGRAFSGQLAGTTGGAAPSSAALLAQLRQRQASIAAAEAGVPGPRRFGGPGSGSGSPGVGVSPQASPPAAAAAGLGAAAPVGATRQLQGRGYSEGDEQTPEPLASAAAAAAGGGGLAGQIAGFIQAAGGSATSDALVSHFGGVLEPEEMPLFKQVLRQVAKLQAAGSGQGKVWVLKQGGSTGQ